MKTKAHHSNSDSVALLIQQKIKKDCIPRYERWLPVMVSRAAEHQGHQGVHVIRPDSGGNEYTIIIRYSSLAAAESWTKSETRKKLIEEIADAFEVPDQAKIHPGIDFWFTPPAQTHVRPKGWKQWLVTTSVIWPLSIIVPLLYKPIFEFIPELGIRGIRECIISSTIVGLVVFIIMPRYVRAISGWLNE